ncbi:MAG: hypothetical protein M1812_003134 [Candelaria pacifica]|nr:MAG: hypothetical protein M1812_003134 [Candelaria pacifica]
MASQQISAKKQQELQSQYSNYKNNLQQLAQKIGDVEQETEEHKLVLETLGPLPEDRRCFRMINGVLVERTVKDVVPALKTNSEGLKKVLDDLVKQYKGKQDEMEKWKRLMESTLVEKEQHPGRAAVMLTLKAFQVSLWVGYQQAALQQTFLLLLKSIWKQLYPPGVKTWVKR